MGGLYPDAPSWRMPYDRDGTVVVHVNLDTATIHEYNDADKDALNDESLSSSIAWTNRAGVAINNDIAIAFLFPELRDLDAWMVHFNSTTPSQASPQIQVSENTTNGLDGDWTTIASDVNLFGDQTDPVTWYRNGINSSTSLAIRAVRVKGILTSSGGSSYPIYSVHLYGEPAPGENPNRLALYHPTLDQRVGPAYFDWGDVPRSSSDEKTFRVKNLSATLTAEDVRVAMESLTDTSPSVVGQHSLSLDGTLYVAQVNVGDLAPGALSGVVRLRRVTPSNATFGPWAFRVFSEADAWT